MSNSYFKFKQFIVHQDKCAMKVCTDSCLFGSIVANEIQHKDKVLDIGCGTGLLSLMYAQKNKANIVAFEIDDIAYEQAKQNIIESKFQDNIALIHGNFLEFETSNDFDLIICNPPFYKKSLKSIDSKRNLALHNDELSYEKLIKKVSDLMNSDAILCLLIPHQNFETIKNIAEENQLNIFQNFKIKQTNHHTYFRNILFFSKSKTNCSETDLCIKDTYNQYTQEFVYYLKDYYLFL